MSPFLQCAAVLALQALYYLRQFRLSVRPSGRPSVTRRYCVKTTARSTVQFAPSSFVKTKKYEYSTRTTPSPEILAASDLSPPDGS